MYNDINYIANKAKWIINRGYVSIPQGVNAVNISIFDRMLRHLSIQNYALIEQIKIDFSSGLTIITGETGARKSVLLGALSLIAGNRADSSVLQDKTRKCIVEAVFEIKNYDLKPFFTANELDYLEQSIIRREVSPEGKSRASWYMSHIGGEKRFVHGQYRAGLIIEVLENLAFGAGDVGERSQSRKVDPGDVEHHGDVR